MKTRLILIILLLMDVKAWIQAETFFLYAHEIFDNSPVFIGESVKEGVLEEIFESDHIIFDDVSRKIIEVPVLLDQSFSYGADYLIVIDVNSEKISAEETRERIASKAHYSLYHVRTEEMIGEGILEVENDDGRIIIPRQQFWYNLGIRIADEIVKIYSLYRNY